MLVDEVRRLSERIASLPPRPRAIFASYDVPSGEVYRQWNTHGQLLLWVNRRQIEWYIAHHGVDKSFKGAPIYGIDVYRV